MATLGTAVDQPAKLVIAANDLLKRLQNHVASESTDLWGMLAMRVALNRTRHKKTAVSIGTVA